MASKPILPRRSVPYKPDGAVSLQPPQKCKFMASHKDAILIPIRSTVQKGQNGRRPDLQHNTNAAIYALQILWKYFHLENRFSFGLEARFDIQSKKLLSDGNIPELTQFTYYHSI